jgi:uncharacterized protein
VTNTEDSLASAIVRAIQQGDLGRLRSLLDGHPELATARVAGPRTPLHVVTDWPGHFPRGADTVALLIAAGADVNARFIGRHTETPLHWAASSNDVDVLDALVAARADLEAAGGVIGNGTPLADAVAFGQWNAARRLIEYGARANLWQTAGLGLLDRLQRQLAEDAPSRDDLTRTFWCACHGGQQGSAEILLDRGAGLNWVGFDGLTPLDAAQRSEAHLLVEWLRLRGARSATEVAPEPT